METILVAFRGRNTSAILADVTVKHDRRIIVCRKNDDLRQDGDITVEECVVLIKSLSSRSAHATLIANGGTTEQLVPVLVALVRSQCGCEILDAQRDGISVLHRHPEHPTEDWIGNHCGGENGPCEIREGGYGSGAGSTGTGNGDCYCDCIGCSS